jgi:aminoglycoside phosphotransferase (APT) family kinase protein
VSEETAPSPASVRAFLRHHGLTGDEITLLPRAGMVNHVYRVDRAFCVRVNRQDVEDDDAYTERAVLPVLAEADIPTPRLVLFDDTKHLLPGTTTVYDWCEGVAIGTCPPTFEQFKVLAADLGAAMARIHALPMDRIEEKYLDPGDDTDLAEQLRMAAESKVLDGCHLAWFARWGARLAERGGKGPTRFLHNDLHGGNIMYDPATGHLTAILDWGDVCYDDPATEFNTLPVWIWEYLLPAYEAAGGDLGEGGEFRLFLHYLDSAFRFMSADFVNMTDIESDWWPRPLSRWAEMAFWMAQPPSPRWREAFALAYD